MLFIDYFFKKHIERCKKELEEFDKNRFKNIREDLRVEARKYIEEINNFFQSTDLENCNDFKYFNNKIKTFNDELNRIMKASANISTLVYVIQNVSEDDFYTYTHFISYFAYDENKFCSSNERDMNYLKMLDQLIEKEEDDFEIYKERGDLREELGLYNDAIDDYKKAMELNPNCKETEEAFNRTKNNIENFINNDPLLENDYHKDSTYYFNKAYNFQNKEKYKESIVYYSRAIELNPNNFDAYIGRGLSKCYLGQYKEAIEDYDKTIELNPNNADAYIGKIFAKYSLGLYEEVIKDCENIIKYFEEYTKNYKETINDNDKMIKLYFSYSEIYNIIGNSKYNLGQYEEAIKDYNKAIELNPNNAEVYNNRGVVKENLNQYQEALKDYKKAFELDPNNNILIKNIKNIQDNYGLK